MAHDTPASERRVLLVEDNPFNQRVIGLMLGRLGYHHDAATSGEQALDLAASTTYDLVLMDFQMPGIDGAETTRRIRGGEGPNARVPIVGLTAVASEEEARECRASGMNSVVNKPIKIERLSEVLASSLASA